MTQYSKGVTVEHRPNNEYDPNKPWRVMDDGLCYSAYATESEAQGIAQTLVGRKDFDLRLELDLNEFIEQHVVQDVPRAEVLKRIRELL